jgi:FKBP-type peptidyl-prolyl cis-trans isomerase
MNRIWMAAMAMALVLGAAACSDSSTGVDDSPPPALSGDTVTTASGLKYIEASAGTGAVAQAGQTASVHYTLWLLNGTFIESSRNGNPYSFTLGTTGSIKGFDEGITGMRVGGRRRLIIPPSLGYGASQVGPIPANSTLIFDVELRSVSN